MDKKIVNNYGSFDIVMKSGKGATLTDISGKKYIDFIAGIGVNCLGHGHKALVHAIEAQASRAIHVSNYYLSDTGVEFANKLLEATGYTGGYFGNSGAEANEAAIKLARKYGYTVGGANKKVIVTLEKSFHGRTLAALTATGQDRFHPECFAPYIEGFRYIKAGDMAALNTAIKEDTCAILFECVQGEGGVNPLDQDYVIAAAKRARDMGALVMIDEVQTGMGRTGTLLANEQWGINPDVVTLAKGIAGGIPMGACLFKGRAQGVFASGDHQSTFGGNPLACAAGIVVLKELLTPGFLDGVKERGEYIRNAIKGWGQPIVKDIRGRGLLIGVEISGDAAAIQKDCLNDGLCICTAGTNILRFLPPLVITWKEIDEGLKTLNFALARAK